MNSRNMVVLIGRLTKDPDLRYLPSGVPVADFSVAVNRSTPKGDGRFEDSLDGFFDCTLMGGAALTFVDDYGKGREVQVTGSLHQSKFKPKGSDREVSRIEVRAKTVAPVVVPVKRDDWATWEPKSKQLQSA